MIKVKLIYIHFILLVLFIGCEEMDINEAGSLVPKTVDEDTSLPSIFVNGTQLHSETFGNQADPMLIFLHGGPGADYRNALNVKQLAGNGYFVVFYDQRGAGLSKRHNKDTYSIQLLLDDLTAVIEHYRTSQNQKVILFGHSWGGILASAYINKYPTKISGAILAEPGGLTWDDLQIYNEKSKKLEFFSEAGNDALYLDQFFTGSENQHQILDFKIAVQSSFSYANGNAEGIEGPSPFWRYGAVTLNSLIEIAENDGFNFTANLNQFQNNILILYSENNKAYDISVAQKEANYFPLSRIERINGTGHEMIYFKWDAVYSKVLTYLNSLNK